MQQQRAREENSVHEKYSFLISPHLSHMISKSHPSTALIHILLFVSVPTFPPLSQMYKHFCDASGFSFSVFLENTHEKQADGNPANGISPWTDHSSGKKGNEMAAAHTRQDRLPAWN